MMTMGAATARLKACNRQQCARKAYDASCLALRDGALTGACYLQRDAAKLYAEAQACTKLADEGADANLTDGNILPFALPQRAGPGFAPLPHQRPGRSVPGHARDDPEADARRGASAAILRQQGQVSSREGISD
jgi:hypothetical protein